MKLPFVIQPKELIRAVGSPEIGVIHFLKKGGISPAESPVDMQAAVTRQAEIQLIYQRAIARFAEEKQISKAEARKLLAGTGEDEETTLTLYDYFNEDETRSLLTLREDPEAIAIRAATLFIKYRVVYPVVVTKAAKSGAKSLQVEAQPLMEPCRIRFPDNGVIIKALSLSDDGEMTTDPIPSNLPEGAIGYILAPNGAIKAGSPEWTEEETRSLLTNDLIQAIYQFYEIEASGLAEQEQGAIAGVEDEGKDSSQLQSLSDLPLAG